ncbi:MAG: hypothetical protein KIT44_15065 [Opitutaceae bacterium]|nr:hypothetical protein [Opitutaceae bacterium]
MRFPRLIILLLLVLFVAGCRPADPLAREITADTAIAFTLWRSRTASQLEQSQWREFDESLQELRFRLMGTKRGGSTETVERELRAWIHGRSIREVLRQAGTVRLDRLTSERDLLEEVIATNARLRTQPGDAESAEYLDYRRSDQGARWEKLVADIEATARRLEELGGRVE